ncbi:SDR family oxidoreductase [Streptomyces griseorubiginosus]|uniref:SDR family NAD(P)-dependent oxidoreductase n=1 Tax=Streptomyces griseorubiginosus TaxID=67304 RepID=UPI002E7FE0EE|nr:SDR family oxidoreductase [Streptomyces griseorubiginosus]WUB42568.1 SDR family oxidoreductase [Streptomyces griseorubiginosus]WUB51086.1 SDR family oxidoreductase [Streptomyces griseorubiginosus]
MLVANAGTSAFAKLEDVTDDDLERVFNTNVKGTLDTVKKALALLTDGASIVLVGSVSGSTGPEGFSVYSASKAAVRSFARSWANELKGRRIRVNVLAPGTADTPGIGCGRRGHQARVRGEPLVEGPSGPMGTAGRTG